MPEPTLPLTTQRLVVVTGKGGVGKSAVAAALARALSRTARRVLAVETGHGRLGTLLGARRPLSLDPQSLDPTLAVAAIEPEEALGEFVQSVLRLRMFSRRLLESTTFQILAAALPGLPEFLTLHVLSGWLDARRLGRSTWDTIVVDAPASGHSLPLLSAPKTLGALARVGPVAERLGSMARRLANPAETIVCVVTSPEELAVRETIELVQHLRAEKLPVAPPIVNGMPPHRFLPDDEPLLAELISRGGAPALAEAARFELLRHRAATEQVAVLTRALGPVVRLPFLFGGSDQPADIARLADDLARSSGLAA